MVAQTLRLLPKLWKLDRRLLAVRTKNKMVSVASSRNGCATIGTPQLSQHNVPRDFAQYVTDWEVEAES
jgi:hypothetical protein